MEVKISVPPCEVKVCRTVSRHSSEVGVAPPLDLANRQMGGCPRGDRNQIWSQRNLAVR